MKNKLLSKLRPRLSLILSLIMITTVLSTFTLASFAKSIDIPFNDINQDAWFYNDVVFSYNSGLMKGVAADKFDPNAPLSRAMMVTMLYRHAGSPAVRDDGPIFYFTDVVKGEWYTDAVKWFYQAGIIYGTSEGTFAPNADITRQDLAVIFDRYAGIMGLTLPVTDRAMVFNDKEMISGYAMPSVKKLFEGLVINGKPGDIFDPKGSCTRAEAAALLHRFTTNAKAQLLEKYGLEISVESLINLMPSTVGDPEPIPGIRVAFTSATNADIPEISLSAKITSTQITIDVPLEEGASRPGINEKVFYVGEGDMQLLGLTEGSHFQAVITVTIGDETQTLTFYPVVYAVY